LGLGASTWRRPVGGALGLVAREWTVCGQGQCLGRRACVTPTRPNGDDRSAPQSAGESRPSRLRSARMALHWTACNCTKLHLTAHNAESSGRTVRAASDLRIGPNRAVRSVGPVHKVRKVHTVHTVHTVYTVYKVCTVKCSPTFPSDARPSCSHAAHAAPLAQAAQFSAKAGP